MKYICTTILAILCIVCIHSQNNSLVFYPKSQASEAQIEASNSLGLFSSSSSRCNAFLLTDQIIMTNEHCIESNPMESYRITFNFGEAQQETFTCTSVLYKNEKLDFALLKLDKAIPKNKYGKNKYPKVVFANKKLKKNDSILIINYNNDNPDYLGDIYKIFSEGNVLSDEETMNPKLYYKALTQGGSSGSAVFKKNTKDGKYYFVGLHNMGYGDIFKDGYKGGISADLIYDKLMSLNDIDMDDVQIEHGFLGEKKVTYYDN